MSKLLLIASLIIAPAAMGMDQCNELLFKKSGDRLNVHWENVNFKPIFDRLAEAGVPLNSFSVRNDPRTPQILADSFRASVNPQSFFYGVSKRYGSWDEGLRLNGFDPMLIRGRLPSDLPEDQIILAIQRLSAAGEPLTPNELNQKRGSPRADEILLQTFGMPLTQQGFYKRAVKKFKTWSAALNAAGLNPIQIVARDLRVVLTRDQIIEYLHFLYPLLKGDLRTSNVESQNEQVKLALYSEYKILVSGPTLVETAITSFGSWRNALEAADLSTHIIGRHARPLYWTEESLHDVLQRLAPLVDMRRDNFRKNTDKIKQLTNEFYGVPIAAETIYGAAKRIYGSWKWALFAADVKIEPAP